MRRLGFLLIGMLLFGVALPFQSHAQVRTPPPPTESSVFRDRNGNPLFTATGERINYLVEPDGYYKAVLDADGAIITREKLADAPPAETQDQAAAPFSAAPDQAEQGSFLAQTWRHGIWGSGIGASGMIPQDLDNDGSLELILTGGWLYTRNYFWYIVSYLPAEQRYEQIWMSRMYGGRDGDTYINRVLTADANQDGRLEIYVAISNGELEIYDAPTRKLTTTISTGLNELWDVQISDLERDGIPELLVSSPDGIRAYAVSNYAPIWRISQGGYQMVVANVDADLPLEIILKDYVIDGATRAVEWNNDFGYQISVADLDKDGKAEIITIPPTPVGPYKIVAFNAELKSQAWEIPTQSQANAMFIGDTDDNGTLEIIYGDTQWGEIHVLDGSSRQQKWKITNPSHGVTRIALGDVDGDGATELLWGAGWNSSAPDFLYVVDTATRQIEWRNIDLDRPLTSVGVGDVDSDGREEIVLATFGSRDYARDGMLFVYDAETHALEWHSEGMLGGLILPSVHSLRLGDVNGDKRQDIVVAAEALYDGVIMAYDGQTHELLWKSDVNDSLAFNSLMIADVDNDGSVEVIGGQEITHSAPPESYVVVLDGATGAEEWRTANLGYWTVLTNIEVSDVDRDGHPDIMFGQLGAAQIYDGVTRQRTWQGGSEVLIVSSANVDGLPGQELLLGRDDGVLTVLDGTTRQPQRTVKISDDWLTAFRVADMNRDGVAELFIVSGSYLYVYDTASWTKIWQSEWLSEVVAFKNHLVVRDIDRDGFDEVLLGTNESMIEFQFNAPPYALEVQSSQATARPGQTITYTAALTNLTNVSATLRLTDTLPLYTELVSGSVSVTGGAATAEAGMVKWLVTLPPSGQVTMTLALRVSPAAPLGTALTSTFGSDNGGFSITRRQTVVVEAILKRLYLPAMFVSEPDR
jgi:uncharacterized repeat protein (TIGR01451 family)